MKSLFPLKEISLRALIYKIHKSEVLVGGRVCVGGGSVGREAFSRYHLCGSRSLAEHSLKTSFASHGYIKQNLYLWQLLSSVNIYWAPTHWQSTVLCVTYIMLSFPKWYLSIKSEWKHNLHPQVSQKSSGICSGQLLVITFFPI